MAAFQFPDPAVTQTVVNPITGSTYQWKEPPGKWVVTVSLREVGDIIWEGDTPPNPIGDYKLWYSTDTLELYFYYCDANGVCAWVPTSAPITMLEDLDVAVSDLKADVYKINIATLENENQIGRTIYFGDAAPTIYDDEVYDGVAYPSELNYKFWFDDSRLELLILFKDEDGDYSYMPVSIPLESLPEPGVSTETFTYTTGRLQTAIEENYLHNLNQDTSIDEIKNDIIELEEEIDAIAPSVERGFFRSTAYDNIPRDGEFMLRTLTGKTIDYGDENIVVVELSKVDDAGVTHTFADTEQGQLIQLFEEGNEDFGLYQIESITGTDPGTTAVTFTVSFVSGSGEATIGDLARLKIFSPPEGGDASEFVKKIGDTMTGTLNMNGTAAVKTRHLDSGNNSDLQIKRNGARRILVGTDAVIFDKIPQCGTNPSADNDLTRKKWVDDNKAAKNHNHDGTYSKTGHTHSYASSNHNHDTDYVKGNYTITKSNGNYYIS